VLKHKTQNYQTSRRKQYDKLYDIGFSNDFLDVTPKHRQQKQKSTSGGYVKVRIFCAAKEATE
jgi:hypothetical protein